MAYYFYRRADATPGFGTSPDEETLECGYKTHLSLPGHVFAVANGYWGRDHGNDFGIPPDGLPLNGVYPAGGDLMMLALKEPPMAVEMEEMGRPYHVGCLDRFYDCETIYSITIWQQPRPA